MQAAPKWRRFSVTRIFGLDLRSGSNEMNEHFVETPEPPYVAVIFTFELRSDDRTGYETRLAEMNALAVQQNGFLGEEGVRLENGRGLTVSYWRDMDAVDAWRRHVVHLAAKKVGREKWYARYSLRIAEVGLAKTFVAGA
jgi:heme-degrading monooxygenase HmoA